MNEVRLSARLAEAARLCGEGSIADIGTDHALLPIKLVLDGHPRAAACDIREGPCERAAANVRKYRLESSVSVFCRPGLENIEEFAPDNIFICGMGGEMIASILGDSDYPKSSRCRLILQPQSMQDVLRRYLCREGFEIHDESVVLDSGKYYQILTASFDGQVRTLSQTEYRLGRLNLERAKRERREVDLEWLGSVLRAAKCRTAGRRLAGHPTIDNGDGELIAVIEGIFEDILKEDKNANS